ncbi:MAG: 3-dehydroquinate synthase [Pseudomonadota bacterium]|nr:3-dehydroquinate synthase [Pseudomonadota bacterium]
MRTLTVELGTRSYPIMIGQSLLGRPEAWTPYLKGRQVLVVSNETVAPLYLETVRDSLAEFQHDSLILPDGEQFKTLDTVERIFDQLLQQRYGRDCTLIALGGGVIGDMTGFASACYQRGVAFLQLPTTLLAQVDSSVGGKTGVNHPLGKNMIGAFHQPCAVVADTATLNTLPDRELRAGLAEVIKYGLIADAGFLVWLESHIDSLLAREPTLLAEAIEISCRTKARIVAADEREQGQRALLNLGHTFGHAIETGMGYGKWLHGEAVAAGMLMAAEFSHQIGMLSADAVARVHRLLTRAGLPTTAPAELDAEQFLELMSVDKKVQAGRLRLVLMRDIGQASVETEFDDDQLHRTLSEFPRSDRAPV